MDHIVQIAASSLLMLFFNDFIEFLSRKREGLPLFSDLPFAALWSALISELLCSPSEIEQAGFPRPSSCFLPCPLCMRTRTTSERPMFFGIKSYVRVRVGEEIFWAQNCHSRWPTKLIACDIDLCPRKKRPGAKLCGLGWVVPASLGGGDVIL